MQLPRPEQAISHGVRFLPQEVSVLPDLSVAENVLIADLPLKRTWRGKELDRSVLHEKAVELLDRLGCDLDPDQPVRQLSSPHKRLGEIARALAGQARVIVMDEPTAALTEIEAQALAISPQPVHGAFSGRLRARSKRWGTE